MAFSEDTEMFPLSALLHNQKDEPYNWKFKWSDIRNLITVRVLAGTVFVNDSAIPVSVTEGTTTKYVDSGDSVKIKSTTKSIISGSKVVSVAIRSEDDIYWRRFGIEQVELPDNTPLVHAIWDRICLRVNETYYDRFLAGETMEQWQRRLQVITDKTIPRYERAFRLYTANATKIDTDIVTQQKTEYDVHDSGSNTSKSKVTDTPDTAINESQNYAGTVSEGSGTNGNDRTGSVTVTMEGAGGILDNINTNIQEWRDLESNLVDEYARAFLSLVWY